MDLYAYMLMDSASLREYVKKSYGEVPRIRGIRLMKFEELDASEMDGPQSEMFARHCGEDVVYIHTRCGSGNYEYFEADKWEASNPTFIESIDDEFDGTYRDHYFQAVPGMEYDKLCAEFEEA